MYSYRYLGFKAPHPRIRAGIIYVAAAASFSYNSMRDFESAAGRTDHKKHAATVPGIIGSADFTSIRFGSQ